MSASEKFYGTIHKAKDGSLLLPGQFVVFLCQDNAFAAVLPLYVEKCREMGADPEQIAGAENLLARVTTWRLAHPEKCKTPDAAGDKMHAMDRIGRDSPDWGTGRG